MVVTHSYIDTTDGQYRYKFYLLMEDYIEAQTALMKIFNCELERFARNLKFDGALFRPFDGDIETIRKQILEKPWQGAEKTCFDQTPGLLILDVAFEQFSPRMHPWIYFSFDIEHHHANQRALRELTDLASQHIDLWDAVKSIRRKYNTANGGSIFEVKPGAFGLSVNLIEGVKFIKSYWQMR